jgi:septal ring factor EnvC (AmiA/AmiB activator)
MYAWRSFWLAVLSTAGLSLSAAEFSLSETRSALEQWVETRRLISRTTADWQKDKEILEQSIRMYERELDAVGVQISNLTTNSAQVDRERAEAEALLTASNAGLERARSFATEFEVQVRKLVPRLPAPLQDSLKPLLNRLPPEPANTRATAAERVQTLVGILNELDKFNAALTLASETRTNTRNEQVAVTTVYVGLGAAYFVNDAADFAGVGSPGDQGWEWTVQPELATSVKEVIRIYRNERGAQFIPLPVTIR